MKYVYGFFALSFAIFLVDLALAHWLDWAKRRDAHITAKRLNRYSMGAFKAVSKDWRAP